DEDVPERQREGTRLAVSLRLGAASRTRRRSCACGGTRLVTGTADLEQAPTDVTRQSPRVTVAILNYNGREFLDVVIPSVFRQSFGDIRVIVIDNGSSDGSVDHIRAQWSAVQVVEIPDNIGVAAALNRAVEAAN